MAYQALYRRYRPRKFSDVIGQNHITTTLKNQVRSGRIAHAYLLCGSRGTGKTTTAKIFARAINCPNPMDGEPCDQCESCLGNAGDGLDIIEIDAASNNGVDEIRDLRDKVRFTPLNGKYKIYIIDEVHMLSAGAFNALLKTLEEPPSHAVFILATTEPQKLPATIHSRCQRYEFHRISVSDIIVCLKAVLEDTGAAIEDGGLNAIARAAEGGMRDALSLADQCIAFCGNEVSTQNVLHVLGSMDQDFMFAITRALIASDEKNSLICLQSVFEHGRDLGVFCRDLMAHFRSLMLINACGDARDLLDCTDEAFALLENQAKTCSLEKTLRAVSLLAAAESDMKYLSYPRVLFEAALLRICRPQDEQSVEALLDRVSTLESRIEQGIGQPRIDSSENKVAPSPSHSTETVHSTEMLQSTETVQSTEKAIPAFKAEKPQSTQAQSKGSKAQEVFKALLPALPAQTQALVQSNSMPWEPHMADSNTLIIAVPPVFKAVADALNTKADQLEKSIAGAYPGLSIRFSTASVPKENAVPANDIEARIKKVFGENVKLEIIEEKGK